MQPTASHHADPTITRASPEPHLSPQAQVSQVSPNGKPPTRGLESSGSSLQPKPSGCDEALSHHASHDRQQHHHIDPAPLKGHPDPPSSKLPRARSPPTSNRHRAWPSSVSPTPLVRANSLVRNLMRPARPRWSGIVFPGLSPPFTAIGSPSLPSPSGPLARPSDLSPCKSPKFAHVMLHTSPRLFVALRARVKNFSPTRQKSRMA